MYVSKVHSFNLWVLTMTHERSVWFDLIVSRSLRAFEYQAVGSNRCPVDNTGSKQWRLRCVKL
jgi:hypothetical protein